MADWVNNGSCTDVSELAMNSLGVTTGSMAATNTTSVKPAYGAPGTDSESVEDSDVMAVPDLGTDPGDAGIQPGDDGKPHADDHDGDDQDTPRYSPPAPSWGKTTVPKVARKANG